MEVLPVKPSRRVESGDSIPDCFSEALARAHLTLRKGDVLAVASKVVAMAEGRVRSLTTFKPSRQAFRLARRYSMSPELVQAVIEEADNINGGVRGALLTVKNGEATANAGIDEKNAPPGSVVMWPSDPEASAWNVRVALERRHRKKVGVIIVDSRVTPMRLGTVGLAIGSSGIVGVDDLRGRPDLHGRRVRITLHAVADDIASTAHLVMGEGAEMVPFAIVRGAPVKFAGPSRDPRLAPLRCLYMSQIVRSSGG